MSTSNDCSNESKDVSNNGGSGNNGNDKKKSSGSTRTTASGGDPPVILAAVERLLETPAELSLEEYRDVQSQIRDNCLTAADCREELLDAARYNDIDVVRALLWHANNNSPTTTTTSTTTSSTTTTTTAKSPGGGGGGGGRGGIENLVLHAVDSNGNTALHMAAANGHVDVATLLLECSRACCGTAETYKKILTAQNKAGNTALHWAAMNGKREAVECLLHFAKLQPQRVGGGSGSGSNKNGGDNTGSVVVVDVLQRNAAGRSALTEGFASQDTATVKALLEHESATEERLVATSTNANKKEHPKVDDLPATNEDEERHREEEEEPVSVTHELVLGGGGGGRHGDEEDCAPSSSTRVVVEVPVRIRELAMAGDEEEEKADILADHGEYHTDRTGLSLWACSVVMAQWIAREVLSSSGTMIPLCNDDVEQKPSSMTVLELGAGCGLPGLTFANAIQAVGSKENGNNNDSNNARSGGHRCRVYLTDLNPLTLENLKHNARINKRPRDDDDNAGTNYYPSVEVLPLNWQDVVADDPSSWSSSSARSIRDHHEMVGGVDVLLGSDLIYQVEMVDLLVQTVRALLKKNTGRFYYVSPSCCHADDCDGDDDNNGATPSAVIRRKGHAEFVMAMRRHFDLIWERKAPDDYRANPLRNRDAEECFLHFNELQMTEYYTLYVFQHKKQEQQQ